ncbi:MAG: hypothetical protein AAAB13_05510 [Pseudomonas sp.]
MRASPLVAGGLALLLGSASPAGACSFDGLALDLATAHPDSLDVAIAMQGAYEQRRIPKPIPLPGGFGLRRVLQVLGKLNEALNRTPGQDGFHLLLIESGLWVRYRAEGNSLRAEPHVARPSPDEPTVITGEGVLLALQQGRFSLDDALAIGLLRIRAPSPQRERIVEQWYLATSTTMAQPHTAPLEQ